MQGKRRMRVFCFSVHWNSLPSHSGREGQGAFISDAKIEAEIHWEGNLAVTWSPVKVREKLLASSVVTKELVIGQSEEYSTPATAYNVSLAENNKQGKHF